MRFRQSPFFRPQQSIASRIQLFLKNNSPLNRLITINIAVYLGMLALKISASLLEFLMLKEYGSLMLLFVSDWLCVPANISTLLVKPWTILTSIFLHLDFFHILFNMIMLWFGGSIFIQYFKPKSLYTVYIIGGIIGNILFILSYNYFPVFSSIKHDAIALGASGGVLSVLIATASKAPNRKVNLIFLGNTSLKWIALFLVLIDIVSIPKGNSGGHFAHLGGALFGFSYTVLPVFFRKYKSKISLLKQKKQKSKQNHRPQRPKTDEQYNQERYENRKKVDEILEKISKSGYQNLTQEEKDFLFKTSHTKNW